MEFLLSFFFLENLGPHHAHQRPLPTLQVSILARPHKQQSYASSGVAWHLQLRERWDPYLIFYKVITLYNTFATSSPPRHVALQLHQFWMEYLHNTNRTFLATAAAGTILTTLAVTMGIFGWKNHMPVEGRV